MEFDNMLYLREISLKSMPTDYTARLPVVRTLQEHPLVLHQPVTFFVSENGTGKSTLLEAIAVAAGFHAEGGTRNFDFSTCDDYSALFSHLQIIRGVARPKDGFFLRAESFWNVAGYLDEIGEYLKYYGGKSLHAQSHGESFLSVMQNRFVGNGLYILDEPEAALSPQRIFALIRLIYELVGQHSQFLIATHSPILTAFPNAEILELDEHGFRQVNYQDTENYRITKQFLDNPAQMLHHLLRDD